MANPDRDTVYSNDGVNRTVYTRENNSTGWFVGIIVALALLAAHGGHLRSLPFIALLVAGLGAVGLASFGAAWRAKHDAARRSQPRAARAWSR